MSRISEINRINLESKASRFVRTFDTRGGLLNKSEALSSYKDFLKEKMDNPVGIKIAMKDVLKKNPISDEIEFASNIAYIEQDKNVKNLLKEVRQFNGRYGKTRYVRAELIDRGRVNHDKVMPALKGFDKFLLRLQLFLS